MPPSGFRRPLGTHYRYPAPPGGTTGTTGAGLGMPHPAGDPGTWPLTRWPGRSRRAPGIVAHPGIAARRPAEEPGEDMSPTRVRRQAPVPPQPARLISWESIVIEQYLVTGKIAEAVSPGPGRPARSPMLGAACHGRFSSRHALRVDQGVVDDREQAQGPAEKVLPGGVERHGGQPGDGQFLEQAQRLPEPAPPDGSRRRPRTRTPARGRLRPARSSCRCPCPSGIPSSRARRRCPLPSGPSA